MRNFLFLCAIIIASTNLFYAAQFKVHNLFSDNMVLQQDSEILIWGWGELGENVKVNFHNQSKNTSINDRGEWKIALDRENYGGPYELHIICGDTIIYKNIMVGEVWICSGQSNMNMPLGGWGRVLNYVEEINSADYPEIRIATIPLTLAESPRANVDVDGWYECSPKTIENFSAVAYFFGRELFKKYNVPIGLIHVSKGGTPIESWMSEQALSKFPAFKNGIELVKNGSVEKFKTLEKRYKKKFNDWLDTIYFYDSGYKSGEEWYRENTDYNQWVRMEIPSTWENAGLADYDGVVWFSKTVTIPDDWAIKELTLCLSSVQDYDITYLNGQKIGEQKKSNYLSVYKIPPKLIKKGNNVITVRVLDQYGNGGLWGRPEEMYLENENGNRLSITGQWNYKPSVEFAEINKLPPDRVLLDRKPTILFNGMISPIVGFAFKGVIWYQGESNAERAYQYRSLFPAMISDWRGRMNNELFPFLFVQLPNYKAKSNVPEESSWAELREAQSMALNIPNTGMAVSIDIGNDVDVHPVNKQEVGRRLALIAREKVYGENIISSGPTLDAMYIEGNKIRIKFKNTAKGLKIRGRDKLTGFAIAGSDKTFHWAVAEINKNDEVLVYSDAVEDPAAVRYAWASNPDCNLYNSVNLPAAPFRTDDWEGITMGKN